MKKLMAVLAIALVGLMIFVSACSSSSMTVPTITNPPAQTYTQATHPAPSTYPTYAATTAGIAPNTGYIGLAAGGAKDIGNFRENIRNSYLPLPHGYHL